MRPVRILIVDDSAVIRRLLGDLLASAPGIVVAGTAANGGQALARIPEVKPDLITLDIEMPGMDGLETLVEIRKLYPKLPVIMFSALTERGRTATLDALARGASDYVTKPSPSTSGCGRSSCGRSSPCARCASRGKGPGQRPSPSLSPERKEKRPERLSSGRLRQPSPRTAKLPAHPMSVWPCCKCHFRNVGLTNEYHGSCAEVTPLRGVTKCYLSESKRENPSKEYSLWPSVTSLLPLPRCTCWTASSRRFR
jgi:CheY-like chemotaxis protein